MHHPYRTHTCGALRLADAGRPARLSGWVHRKRDHGQLLFVDLRDHYGITQCVVDVSSPMFRAADALRLESVVTVTGQVAARSADTVNPRLPTGEVELVIAEIEVRSEAEPLPFPVNIEAEYPEDMRLAYRFLDLRRERTHANIMLRSNVIASIRRRMIEQGFAEFQTPILTASSPEGARDFLVPSRLHPGEFYALPQSPQQFKQLLMVAGFDRYFQIAPCFRDEAGRADRSPGEHYQLDVEMSFVTQEDVFAALGPVLHGVFEEFGAGRPVTALPFPQIAYADAMQRYGSDKPDLRNPIVMSDVTATFRGSAFRVFANLIDADPEIRVWAIPAPTGGSRAFCDQINSWAQSEGQPGLAYIFFRDGEGAGPVARSLGAAATADLRDVRATADYWRGGYTAITPQRDANGAVTESDPQMLLLAANAAFRGGQAETDRASALRRVDAVIKNYADVLRSNPGHMDAAYNYEYAIRVRELINKSKAGAPAKPGAAARAAAKPVDVTGDLPSGPTLHGRPGGPPPSSDMSQFKIVIPKRGDERKENPEAGKGGTKVRRG
ncbi:MAG TPA: aspartate--tRNA ligase [Vicinamibacterales bacterium]|nr:aspartate--tRNA ligase [Vicinamibacterales bacterium]